MSTYKHSEACCTIPPVVGGDYKTKGEFTTVNGMKTYVTGSSSADTAILLLYDIFGYTPQILQGADIIAGADKEHPYQVYMPDFWDGKPADFSWYPPDTEEKQQKFGDWMKGASPPIHLPKVPEIIKDAQKQNPNIKTWGFIGYCWGGKMGSLLAGQDEVLFKAVVQTSPAMVDPADAEKVKVPMMMLASNEEPVDDVKNYDSNLKVKKHTVTFDKPHGWMSARADLNDESDKAEYIRGYEMAMKFFHDHL